MIFKTHLDIGFTDMAQNVVDHYMKSYLPNAMRVAKQMRGEKERFIWTTGSWLIRKFLEESPDRKLLEDAIRHGEVRWHGLPFTTHTELMDRELFRYGLGISAQLDERFHRNTTAAKLTDVPGHTRAMVPYLAEAGIRFLHIGVNPASHRPQVPDLFWWEDESGERILVMYNSDYGNMTEIGESGVCVYFAHTGDNRGPQSAEQIRAIYQELHEQYPEAELCAGTLEDVAAEALLQENLPVITDEIGDTWIYGAGTDPKKVNWFRGLLRLKHEPGIDMEPLYRELLNVPEHTWGLDEKTWIGSTKGPGNYQGDYVSFSKERFREARKTEGFRAMEASWEEQRDYVRRAAGNVPDAWKAAAAQAMSAYRREPWNVRGYESIRPGESRMLNGWNIAVNESGAVCLLEKEGQRLADSNHPLGAFSYQVFSVQDYERFQKQYLVSSEEWAYEDFGKIGMEQAVDRHYDFVPSVTDIWAEEDCLVIRMRLPEEAVARFGGMKELELAVCPGKNEVAFDFAWWGKEASRIAEGSWLQFAPPERVEKVHKLGRWIDPSRTVRFGNRRMHAVDEGVQFETLRLKTQDAPLIGLGERTLVQFPDSPPDMEHGIYCCLHNNVWGTNFPMWYEEDARFRFVLKM